MKTFSGKRGIVLVLAGSLLLLASGAFHASLIDMRKSRHLQQVAPEDTTPLVAVTTVAFGGFRGLVADALWVRANKMQEEGQYFEMVQLAKWITQLEPRVPEVWSFQAWNLAYNISVLFPEYNDRWRWVNHGLDLLRKQGLTNNPNSPDLHWDIGWMFQHKIGMNFDSANQFYKRKLMEQVEEILPEGRFDAATLDAEAKANLEETFSMKPEKMQSLEDDFGPLDWRLPDTHALYWSTVGLDYARKPFDERRLRRMRMQSLAALVRGGKILASDDREVQIRIPRLDLIDPVIAEYQAMLGDTPHNHYLQKGYGNFLNDATLLNADYGNLDAAFTYYELLAEMEENLPSGRENFQRYIQMELTRDPRELSYDQAMSRIVALILQSNETADPIRSRSFIQSARQLHLLYQQGRINPEHKERTGLPPFETMVSLVEKRRERGF